MRRTFMRRPCRSCSPGPATLSAGDQVIVTIEFLAGQTLNLDLSEQLGPRVELECFQFISPPIEFRLTRGRLPLQDWQTGNRDLYDLQHGPAVQDWCRDDHLFINDCHHRDDVATCGVLAKGLTIETTGLNFPITLMVWPRESTCSRGRGTTEGLTILSSP